MPRRTSVNAVQLRFGYLVLVAMGLTLTWSLHHAPSVQRQSGLSPAEPATVSESPRQADDAPSALERCREDAMDRIATCRVHIDTGSCNASGCGTQTYCNQDTGKRDCERSLRASTNDLGRYFCDLHEPDRSSDDLDALLGRICVED